MRIIYNEAVNGYENPNHPEGTFRINGIEHIAECVDIGDSFQNARTIYSERYIDKIRNACSGNHSLDNAEVKCSKEMFRSAIISTNLAVNAAMNGDFAITRPPGHHSGFDYSRGFCLFNNIAIAVKQLVDKGHKVAILDIDGHYGNGTEEIFAKNENVFYGSIHQKGSYLTGNKVNSSISHKRQIDLSTLLELEAGSGDVEYKEAFDKLIEALKKFNPEIIGVSAGFDALIGDQTLNLQCSEKIYTHIGRTLGKLNKKVFAVLEGGYHENVLKCIQNFVNGINATQGK